MYVDIWTVWKELTGLLYIHWKLVLVRLAILLGTVTGTRLYGIPYWDLGGHPHENGGSRQGCPQGGMMAKFAPWTKILGGIAFFRGGIEKGFIIICKNCHMSALLIIEHYRKVNFNVNCCPVLSSTVNGKSLFLATTTGGQQWVYSQTKAYNYPLTPD